MYKKTVWILSKIFILVLLMTFILFPIIYSFIFSNFSITEELKDNNSNLLIDDWSFDNYKTAFNSGYLNTLLFSFIFTLFLVLFRLLLSGTAGYVLSKDKWKYKKIFIVFLFFLTLIPESSLLIGMLKMTNEWNLQTNIGIIFGLTLPSVFSLFSILLFRDGFLSITNSQVMMIKIDNLSFIKKLEIIYLPKLNLAISMTTIIAASTAWNSFLWPSLFLLGKQQHTLGTWIFSIGTLPNGNISQAVRLAGNIMYTLPVIVIYLISHKKILKSFKNI